MLRCKCKPSWLQFSLLLFSLQAIELLIEGLLAGCLVFYINTPCVSIFTPSPWIHEQHILWDTCLTFAHLLSPWCCVRFSFHSALYFLTLSISDWGAPPSVANASDAESDVISICLQTHARRSSSSTRTFDSDVASYGLMTHLNESSWWEPQALWSIKNEKEKASREQFPPLLPGPPFENQRPLERQKLSFSVSNVLIKDLWRSLLHSAIFAGESKKEHDQLLHMVLCMPAADSSIVLTPVRL